MSFLPTDPTALTINAERLVLQTGSATYSVLQDLRFHLERPELREPITGLGTTNLTTAVYFYGPGNNYLEATLLMSDSEYNTFAETDFTRDVNGRLPTTFYQIVGTNLSGGTVTVTNNANSGFKAIIVFIYIDKPVIGGVKVRLRLRLIEDRITVNIAGPA